ncbi:cell envelope integrity protein CreD [Porticoccus sp. W117]|uniref:cell envelope integrity protein CreD n=1 Tax=Porticoccus sp. W117 TaxID=3054777 RepID=UPI0025942127|nr:cell envelope integrity protein CreD [Porticoccus sp. W117]MDM3872474.1 cell envelope integrity protein CreD [Porticoccus sp. W117]
MKRLPLLLKGGVLLLLALLLLIPLSMVGNLVGERMARQHQVEAEIANSTASPQWLAGPLLTIRYTERWTEQKERQKSDGDKLWAETYETKRVARRVWRGYPQQLQMSGEMAVEPRYRGIFAAQVYHLNSTLSGHWQMPGLDQLPARDGSNITVDRVQVSLLVNDRKGFLNQPQLTLSAGGNQAKPQKLVFKPGSGLAGWDAGVHTDLPLLLPGKEASWQFDINLMLQGTSRFALVPLADNNQLALAGDWPHPSFDGQFLPLARAVENNQFNAEWQVTAMASSAQSELNRGLKEENLYLSNIQNMGVSLINPVSVYSNTDRALKYGFLFVGLTFASFLLYELLMRLRIHPVQYGLVGLAQALFFLLLLSLSEHLGFGSAYLLAMLCCVGLVGYYLASVLGSVSRGAVFAAALAGVYGMLYLLLQSEDYALLGGSLALFGLLAGAMALTRKLDWYRLESQLSRAQ